MNEIEQVMGATVTDIVEILVRAGGSMVEELEAGHAGPWVRYVAARLGGGAA
ncbi:hypothetical protein FAM15061_000702 [Propionibacterium freudenreichii]|uniref:hypothetical protein n=1 Tax=Propionibacterium freudenreichii TaxID=1744 RepID=UPI000542882C|nr:hypothetical protein [Propionibacterium freudenreichii]MDK9610728.1 hypothetical protein [Propionibacterium freudenreichii]MDK9621604.1 hypothetical protein [Propionibacterium freudenreichii]MDK9622739.1 hypothetical protein [Propionibacterium freudenreichii]MDK9655200.1 hypothetical protein [Propionibacterium freudenreichii]CEH02444.1 Hypothetical protein PFCIRM125_05400 [Propionibacterium freudenreichii]